MKYLRRARLAARLTWAALRGKTVEIETSSPTGEYHFVGILRGE